MRQSKTPPDELRDSDIAGPLVQLLLGQIEGLGRKLDEIESMLGNHRGHKEWYTVAEAAEILDRAEFTVREWCRLGRVYAEKRACGRGRSQEWILSQEEIERIQNQGLLPGPSRQ